MRLFFRLSAIFLTLSVTASVPYSVRTEYYYNVTKLKVSGPPERLRLVSINNLSTGKPVVFEGILFTYKDRKAGRVGIGGNFSSWKVLNMTRGKDGVWFYFLSNRDFSGAVEYKFNVDGLWTEDPSCYSRKDDRHGSYISVAGNRKPDEGRLLSYRFLDGNRVEFRIYSPDARIISLVGDFNGWNPENDLLRRGDDGVWRLEKRLAPGEYRYKFIIDGEWKADMFNPRSSSDSTGDLCSLIRVD